MSIKNDLTIDDRIEYVKEKIEFFNRPLIYLFPIYPEDDGDEYTSPREFNIDIIDIESEFGKFQDKFNSVFTTKSEKKNAIKYFDQFFNHQLGFVWVKDEDVPSGETHVFRWSALVHYDYYDGSDYWVYFRAGDDENNHIFKGYDEKIEQLALEAHKGLINKFETFKKEKEIEIFEGDPLPVKKENDKNQPSTLIDLKIKKRQEELRRSIKDEINTLDKQWKSAFFKEKDCDDFIEILVSYFTNQEYSLPDDPIPTQKGCKTKLSIVLNSIYKLGLTNKMLSRDDGYLKICKILFVFSGYTLTKIYEDIGRNNKKD